METPTLYGHMARFLTLIADRLVGTIHLMVAYLTAAKTFGYFL
jgi:hypothetical protein